MSECDANGVKQHFGGRFKNTKRLFLIKIVSFFFSSSLAATKAAWKTRAKHSKRWLSACDGWLTKLVAVLVLLYKLSSVVLFGLSRETGASVRRSHHFVRNSLESYFNGKVRRHGKMWKKSFCARSDMVSR